MKDLQASKETKGLSSGKGFCFLFFCTDSFVSVIFTTLHDMITLMSFLLPLLLKEKVVLSILLLKELKCIVIGFSLFDITFL